MAVDAVRYLEEHGIHTVMAGGFDTHGALRAKRMSAEAFLEAAAGSGIGFSDVFWVLDIAEGLVEPASPGDLHYFPRKEKGFGDIFGRPDLNTLTAIPWDPGVAVALCDYETTDGNPVPISPRQVLKALVQRAGDRRLRAVAALELEFYVFEETVEVMAQRGFHALRTMGMRPYTYSGLKGARDDDFIGLLRQHLNTMGIAAEACNPETGPGQYEINLRHQDALRMADQAALYKTLAKDLARRNGKTISFMAKPHHDWAGSSGHLHLSLWDTGTGRNLMHDHAAPFGVSAAAGQAMAGILATLPELVPLHCPTPNSYKRLRPYSWASTTATWGHDNRSTGIRALCEGTHSARVELRLPGADVNPYITIAACLAGALHGIEQGLEPPPAYPDDAYADPSLELLPLEMEPAVARLAASTAAPAYLGADFVHHYLALQQAELQKYRAAVGDWERQRYLEMI